MDPIQLDQFEQAAVSSFPNCKPETVKVAGSSVNLLARTLRVEKQLADLQAQQPATKVN